MALLVDTGVLYALADRDDSWHQRSRAYLEANRELLVAPEPVLPEVAYLLRERLGAHAELAFVTSVANGELAVEPVGPVDLARCVELMAQYESLGFVDAAVVAIAERLELARLLTTDRRHFAAVRPRHAPAFELLP
jgi:predicted nucleic acid-binding protein